MRSAARASRLEHLGVREPDAGRHVGDEREARARACPSARAAITSGTVDMPTTSAPSARSIATSAGVS